MPRSTPRDATGRFATAKVRLVMEGGRKVREELVVTGKHFSEHIGGPVAGTAVYRTEIGVRSLIASLFQLRTVIATVGKALISGFAITAVFGALFAAVGALKEIFVDVGKFAVKTVSQLKEMQLGLQALLATTGEFSTDIGKNFELAGRAASRLRSELIVLDPRTLGGLKELQVATQALLATGAQGMVSSTEGAEELAGAASLLVNTVVLLTGRVNDQRQIFSEIKELMLGNVRAQNQVAQLISSQVGDLDAWLAKTRENRNLLEELEKVLGGINKAADKFLNTLTSVQASEEQLAKLITEAAYKERVDDIIRWRRELLDYTQANMKAIARSKEEMSAWAFIWQRVVLLSDELLARIQVMRGEIALSRDRSTARLISQWELFKAQFTGEIFELPTLQRGEGDSLGLSKSKEVLDRIREGIKGLASDIKKIHDSATKSVGALMDEYSKGLFNLNNKLTEANENVLKPLRDALAAMEAIRKPEGGFGLDARITAAKEVMRLRLELFALEDSLAKYETNTLTALWKKREEARLKSAKRVADALLNLNAIHVSGLDKILTIEEKVDLARNNALRSMRRQLDTLKKENDELVKSGVLTREKMRLLLESQKLFEAHATARIDSEANALREQLQLESARRVAGAETALRRLSITGLNKVLTIEEQLSRAREGALVTLRRQLDIMVQESVAAEQIAMWEENTVARINEQVDAQREYLLLKRKERIDATMLDLQNLTISGLTRILTIEQQVEHARQGALRSLERHLNVLRENGVAAREWLLVQIEMKGVIDSQSKALKKQLDLQESLREGRHLIERFRLQREGVILPGDQPTGIRDLLDERERRMQQLEGLRADEDARPSDVREAETLVASLESELRNLLSTANSVASVIGGALTKAVLSVMDKGGNIMDFLKNLRVNLKAVGEQMLFAFGQAFANAIQGLITGTGSVKEVIGSLIIAIGNLAIALGTVLVLGSIFFGFGSVPIGLALMAAGAGMIAIGALLGGSGSRGGALGAQPNATNQTPTFSFNQAQVDVQQDYARSNADLVQATSSLAEAHKSLESMPPGVVVKKGNTENGGLLTSVSRESSQGKQYTAQTNLAKNLGAI